MSYERRSTGRTVGNGAAPRRGMGGPAPFGVVVVLNQSNPPGQGHRILQSWVQDQVRKDDAVLIRNAIGGVMVLTPATDDRDGQALARRLDQGARGTAGGARYPNDGLELSDLTRCALMRAAWCRASRSHRDR